MKIKEPNELSCEGILEYSQYAYLIVKSFVKINVVVTKLIIEKQPKKFLVRNACH